MEDKKNKIYSQIYKLLSFISELVHFNIINKNDAQRMTLSLIFLKRVEDLSSNIDVKYKVLDERFLKHLRSTIRSNPYFYYNISNYDLKSVWESQGNIYENITKYLEGYNDEIKNIIIDLDFFYIVEKISKYDNYLLNIIKIASEIDLSIESCTRFKMDDILVDIYNRTSYQDEKDIPRDVLDLITRLTFSEYNSISSEQRELLISDYSLGIGSLLIESIKYLEGIENQLIEIIPIGTERNRYKFLISKLRLILLGYDNWNIENNNSLISSYDSTRKVLYSIMLDPQDLDYDVKYYNQMLKEESEGNKKNNRFKGGLPKGSNGFYLFLQHIYYMLQESSDYGGKASILSTGYPLTAKQGNQNKSIVKIREWILKEDFIEAIVALPSDLFYNTSISYYIWIINKNKNNERKGHIQFIDAGDIAENIRKQEDKKLKVINNNNIDGLVKTYQDNKNKSIARIVEIKNIRAEENWISLFNELN